jgi:putative transposase
MPRPPRIEYEGAVYHLTSRGNGRQVIFHTDEDRRRFLQQLQDNLKTFAVELYAFVLMSNHYHLLVRTNRANVSRFAQRLNTSYGLYYRYKHRKPGHVFQGRYKTKLVDGDEYLLRLTRYIHLNPVKTKKAEGRPKKARVAMLEAYAWSSYPGYVAVQGAVPWVNYRVLKRYGRSWREARRRYKAYTHAMVMESDEPLTALLGANAYAIGDEEFLGQVEERLKLRRRGEERDRDLDLPEEEIGFEEIDRVVSKEYGVPTEALKAHGHVAGEAKVMALELAARLSGRTQRAIGRYYGGISSSAVAMMRQKIRKGGSGLQARAEVLQEKLDS